MPATPDPSLTYLVNMGRHSPTHRRQLLHAQYAHLLARAKARARAANDGAGLSLGGTALCHSVLSDMLFDASPAQGRAGRGSRVTTAGGPNEYQSWRHFLNAFGCRLRHRLVDHARARGRRRNLQENVARLTPEAVDESDGGRAAADVQSLRAALDAMRAVRPTWHEVVQRNDLSGETYEQIADALGCSVKTVQRRHQMAMAYLRRKLAGRPEQQP